MLNKTILLNCTTRLWGIFPEYVTCEFPLEITMIDSLIEPQENAKPINNCLYPKSDKEQAEVNSKSKVW